jgi:hypothetical protein
MSPLLRNWWHQGEVAGSDVFRQGWAVTAAVLAVAAGLLCFVPACRSPAGLVLVAFALFRGVAERRRAVVFWASGASVRPPIGRCQSVALADVVSVTPKSVAVPFTFSGRLLKGIRVGLRDGRYLDVPLDFPARDEIKRRFLSAAGVVGGSV